MSNPSTQKENRLEPYDDTRDFLRHRLPFMLLCVAVLSGVGYVAHIDRKNTDARIAREMQEWWQARKDVVECDFGRGIQFSAMSQNPADVPEGIRPTLTAGLASGACRLAYPQS